MSLHNWSCFPDDDDAFLAALSFLDEFPFDTESNVNTEHHLQPLPCLKPMKLDVNEAKQRRRRQVNERKKLLRKAGVYADPNRARSERRQEIALLREQLEQLQIDVQVLRSREVKRRLSVEEPPSALSLPPQVPAVWQEMALRQRQRREEAERENIQLKLVLKRQQQVAQALGDLVRRRAFQVTKECADLMTQPRFRHHAVNVLDVKGDMEDFRLLILGLEAAYLEMEDVFAANGLSGSELPPVDIHLREGVDRRHIECFSYKVLPFALRVTTAAVWEHFKGVEKHFGGGNIYTKAAKDLAEPYTIIENFTKELYSNTSRADIKVKQVVRRYVEQDHDVVIWLAHVAPAQIKHKMLRGLAYTLRGYAVTKQSQVAGQEVSVLQQCSIISFDRDAGTRCSPTKLDTLMNFLVVNSAQNIRSHRERIEDMLVDQVVGRRIH